MTTNALAAAADKLADLLLEGGKQGLMLPDYVLASVWALIGISYTVTRHPESAEQPIPGMIADLDQTHATLAATIAEHNRRCGR
ncbi:MAG: hypothetical protein QM606_05805 [Leucobacter sp.]